jgi:PAS domain S-box-containing protein
MKRPEYVEEALKKSEERYRNLVETSQDLIFRLDLDGRFMYLNSAWEHTHGYKPDDMKGKKFTDFQDKDESENHIRNFEKALEDGTTIGYETTQLSKSGGKIYLKINAMLLLDGDWHVIGIQGTAHDITKQKIAELALKESEKKYKSIFENIRDVYFEISTDWIIIEISPSVEEILLFDRKDLIEKPLFDLFKYSRQKKKFDAELSKKGKLNDFEVVLKNKAGSDLTCSISAKVICDSAGNPEKTVGSIRDISERKHAEAARLEKEKFEGVIETAGAACHELNQPLQVVLGSSEMLMMNLNKDDSNQNRLRILKEQVERLGKITRKLQNITKYETKDYLDSKIIDIDKASK